MSGLIPNPNIVDMATTGRLRDVIRGMRYAVVRVGTSTTCWRYTAATGDLSPVQWVESRNPHWERLSHTTDLVPTLSTVVTLVDGCRQFPI